MLRKLGIAAVLSLLVAAFAAVPALAVTTTTVNLDNAPQGAHFAKGETAPTCTLSGLTVSCTGTAIEGVGNTNAVETLAVTSTFTGYCHNPGTNDKIVDPFTRQETTTTSSTLTPSKNGRLVVTPTSATGTSSAEFLASFTCPNPNWTAEITGTSISYVYTLTFVGFDQPAIMITGP